MILGVVSIINPVIFSEKSGQKNQTLMVLAVTLIATAIFYYLTNNQNSNPILFGIILVAIFFGFLIFLGGTSRSLHHRPQRHQDADALYAFKSRGFGGEIGLTIA